MDFKSIAYTIPPLARQSIPPLGPEGTGGTRTLA